MKHLRRFAWSCAVCLATSALLVTASAQKADKDAKGGKDQDASRPQLRLKAQPVISMAPLSDPDRHRDGVGGPNDAEEFYCPTVEWDRGDGTRSESTTDCAPYEPGKSEIKRRFTVEHIFRAGSYRVMFKLKRREKPVASAGVSIQVRPGLRDIG